MTYGFTSEELDQLTAHVSLISGRRNLAMLDAMRHSHGFINATQDDQHAMEAAVIKAMDSVAMPDLRRIVAR